MTVLSFSPKYNCEQVCKIHRHTQTLTLRPQDREKDKDSEKGKVCVKKKEQIGV